MPINVGRQRFDGVDWTQVNTDPTGRGEVWTIPSFAQHVDPLGSGLLGYQLTGAPNTWTPVPFVGSIPTPPPAAQKQIINYVFRGGLSAVVDRFYLAPSTQDASFFEEDVPIQPGFVADQDYTHIRVWGNVPVNGVVGAGLRLRIFLNDDGIIAVPIAQDVTTPGQTGSFIWIDADVTITQGNVVNTCLDRDTGGAFGNVETWLTTVLT
jgi:hypothetical protein